MSSLSLSLCVYFPTARSLRYDTHNRVELPVAGAGLRSRDGRSRAPLFKCHLNERKTYSSSYSNGKTTRTSKRFSVPTTTTTASTRYSYYILGTYLFPHRFAHRLLFIRFGWPVFLAGWLMDQRWWHCQIGYVVCVVYSYVVLLLRSYRDRYSYRKTSPRNANLCPVNILFFLPR